MTSAQPVIAVQAPSTARRGRTADGNAKYIFLLPAMIYILILGIFPLLFSLRLVFGAWNAGQKNITWVGFDNIQRLLSDNRFWDSFWKTLAYVALAAGLELLIGLA